jgi:hypothetical protein
VSPALNFAESPLIFHGCSGNFPICEEFFIKVDAIFLERWPISDGVVVGFQGILPIWRKVILILY